MVYFDGFGDYFDMNCVGISAGTDIVPVYDRNGRKLYEVKLPEKVMPLPYKRTAIAESGVYYKGCGIVYRKHMVNQQESNMRILEHSRIIYEKYVVSYINLAGRFGIFTFPHQPIFSDMEGTCGKKELKLLENQRQFELSAIQEITAVIPTGIKDSNVYAYRLKSVKAEPMDIINLIEYILTENFNTAWDKNLWADIFCYQYVRDVADWFPSSSACHKLGTIFALLNSLYHNDIYLYTMLLRETIGVMNTEKIYIPYFSAQIVDKYCPGIFDLDIENDCVGTYAELLRLLFSGKACCHLEDDEKWQWVREHYCAEIGRYEKAFQRRKLL